MPYIQRTVDLMLAALRESAAERMIDGIGQKLTLSPSWRRGNQNWDRVNACVSRAIDDDELRNGRLFLIRWEDILATVKSPWSNEELEFLDKVATTNLGRASASFLDLTVAIRLVARFESLIKVPKEAGTMLREVNREAKKEIENVKLEIIRHVELSSEIGERIFARIEKIPKISDITDPTIKSALPRLQRVADFCRADIVTNVEEFRNSSAGVGAPSLQ